jgi:phosphodiester glycosidase
MAVAGKPVYARVAAVLMAVGLVAACAPPDEPPTLSRALPAAVVDVVKPDTVRTVRLSPGVIYRYLWSDDGPWAIHLVEASLGGRCDLTLDVLRPESRESGEAGFETVTSMVARSSGGVVAAVNADLFTPEGTTVGSEIVDGLVTAARSRPAIGWRWNEAPWIGSPLVTDDFVDVGWVVPRAGGDGLTEAVGGFPELISEGERLTELGASAATRHPRTAVGYSTETGRLWLVVVDGRQPPHSSGMTLIELSALFEALGADEALNLDGGGSSVMVLGDHAVSSPSDESGERAVVNGLALRRQPAACGVTARR